MEDDQVTDNPAPHELPAALSKAIDAVMEAGYGIVRSDTTQTKIWTVCRDCNTEAYPSIMSHLVCRGCTERRKRLQLETEKANAEHPSWKAQCHAQAEQIVALRDLIFEMEWVYEYDLKAHYCPVCEGKQPEHAPDCKLAKIMEPYR